MRHPPVLLRPRQAVAQTPVTVSRQELGRRGEELARRRLSDLGYQIIEANYRASSGEIDLVAERDGAIVFVEVRTKATSAFGSPEDSIDREKQAHMVAAAQEYLQAHDAEHRDWRIDVVAIELARNGRVLRLDVLENAVEL